MPDNTPLVDSRDIVATDNAVVIAVSNRSEAQSLVDAMIAAGIVCDVDES
jgi:hypothetical protein